MSARRWLLPALAGIAAVALGLGAAELAAAIVAPTASPVLVIGSLLIDFAPSWAKETAIALFGTGDKAALLVGIGLVLLVISAAAGVLQWRRPPLGRILIAAGADLRGRRGRHPVGCRGPGCRSRRPWRRSSRWSRSASCSAGCRSRRPRPPHPEPAPRVPATRPAARSSAGPAAPPPSVLSPRSAAPCCSPAPARRPPIRDAFTLPSAAVAAPPIPAGAELGIPGLATVITPNAEFYRIDTALQIPRIDPTHLVAAHHRRGRERGRAHLGRADRAPARGERHDPDVRLERGRRRPDRQRASGWATRSASC